MRRHEFRLLYQPIRSPTDGRLLGVEALIRWRHPERGTLYPADFLDIAEEIGLIVPMGAWVLEEALRQTAAGPRPACGRAGGRRSTCPPANWPTPACAARHRDARSNGLDPSAPHLEVTEIDAGSRPRCHHRPGALRARACASPSTTSAPATRRWRTCDVPVDTIKIDRSFIANVDRSTQDATIVTAIVAMAHALDLEVVAEGVERSEQRDVLRGLGCDRPGLPAGPPTAGPGHRSRGRDVTAP